jgi:hypothetical protein
MLRNKPSTLACSDSLGALNVNNQSYTSLSFVAMANSPESTTAEELLQANKVASTDAAKAEELYRGILSRQTSMFSLYPLRGREWATDPQYFDKQADSIADEDALRDQEQALIKLGALYRDHKYVCFNT